MSQEEIAEVMDWFYNQRPDLSQAVVAAQPARCSWVSVWPDHVVVAVNRDVQKAHYGAEAQALKDALRNRAWTPKLAGSARNGTPIFYH